jgi:hypothetical protein
MQVAGDVKNAKDTLTAAKNKEMNFGRQLISNLGALKDASIGTTKEQEANKKNLE